MSSSHTQQRTGVDALLQDLERYGLSVMRLYCKLTISHRLSYDPHGATMFLVDSQKNRYPLHSIALARCDFLNAMTRNTWQESTKGEVCLDDEDPEDVKLLHQCELS